MSENTILSGLSFNERVRRAVKAYDVAREHENTNDFWHSGVGWCKECGFVPHERMHGSCTEFWHYVDEGQTIMCSHADVDNVTVSTKFVAEHLRDLMQEYLDEHAEEEAVEELFRSVPERVFAEA